jgi:hypothetical protein
MIFVAPFSGVKTGDIYPTDFKPGDECPPELESSAIALRCVEDDASKAKKKADK